MFELFASMVANDLLGDAMKDLGVAGSKGLLSQVTGMKDPSTQPEMAAPGATPGVGYEDTNAGMAEAAKQLQPFKPNPFATMISLASNPNANFGDLLKGTEYEKYAPYANMAFSSGAMPNLGFANNLARQAYGR